MSRVNIFINKLLTKTFSKNYYHSTQTCNPIHIRFNNGVKEITLCDPKTRNALSINMMEHLIEELRHENDDPELRVVVIGAEGHVFSAGHDLKELSHEHNGNTHKKVFDLALELMRAIIESPIPIVAKVNGVAAAAGCQLVAQCDISICSRHSSFLTPGINVGIFCSTPGVALSRTMHKNTTLKMLLTGRPISADEAKNAGLITEICNEGDLDSIIASYCEDIKNKSREVIAFGKRFYFQQLQLEIKEAYKIGGDAMLENLQLSDGKEGIDSFIQKRKAVWTHGGIDGRT